ncbi:MAG: hypothetical protein ACKO51_11075 [Alphaproteobacteria bacterium]
MVLDYFEMKSIKFDELLQVICGENIFGLFIEIPSICVTGISASGLHDLEGSSHESRLQRDPFWIGRCDLATVRASIRNEASLKAGFASAPKK